jgi:hypothetical protein
VPGQRRNALRHRRAAGAEIDERFGERIDERVEIEQRLHVLAGEDEHYDTFFSQRAPAGSRDAVRRPARFIRPRFAAYQS